MDINAIVEHENTTYELKHPDTGSPLGIVYTLAGRSEVKRRKSEMNITRQMLRRSAKAGKMVFDDPEERYEQQTDFLVECTIGWTGWEKDGQPLTYSPAAAREIYENPKLWWVRDQVDKALADTSLFIRSSSGR